MITFEIRHTSRRLLILKEMSSNILDKHEKSVGTVHSEVQFQGFLFSYVSE